MYRFQNLQPTRGVPRSRCVEELVYELRKVFRVLIQKAVPRIRIQMQLSISMVEHLPHENTILCWQEQIIAAF